jgi:hypothetical protein
LEKDEAARARQGDKAIEWISRAILRDPLDPALQIKLADVYGMHERYDEAVSIFERLERDERLTSACKAMVRLLSSVYRWTLDFHNRFPDEADGLFNASCGYAQLYGVELRNEGAKEIPESENRKMRSPNFGASHSNRPYKQSHGRRAR